MFITEMIHLRYEASTDPWKNFIYSISTEKGYATSVGMWECGKVTIAGNDILMGEWQFS